MVSIVTSVRCIRMLLKPEQICWTFALAVYIEVPLGMVEVQIDSDRAGKPSPHSRGRSIVLR
jgi:hypothetical protein